MKLYLSEEGWPALTVKGLDKCKIWYCIRFNRAGVLSDPVRVRLILGQDNKMNKAIFLNFHQIGCDI